MLFVLALTAGGLSVNAAELVPEPPRLEASAYLLEDYSSGKVLAEKNLDARVEPASLTKLMTVYAVFSELANGHLTLDEKVRISPKARKMPGSRMFVEVDSLVSVKDLLLGIIVQSGNDASVAIAEHVAGDESAFSNLMNQHAKRLGMTGSHFVNSSGLPHPDHYTTARDMGIIAKALIRDFPEHYDWHALAEFEHNGINQPNRNRLLFRDERVDGLKTGYTKSAGYCIVVSGKQKDMRLIVVVMGTESDNARVRQAQALINYGFRFYETHRLFEARQPVTSVRVWKGNVENLNLGLTEDLFLTVPRGKYSELKAQTALDQKIHAPVKAGESRGQLNVKLAGEVVADRPLVALHPVPEGNLWRQVTDHVKLMLE